MVQTKTVDGPLRRGQLTYTNSLGNGTYGAASLTDITHFKWTAPGTSTSERTATSHGQTSRVTVRPQ